MIKVAAPNMGAEDHRPGESRPMVAPACPTDAGLARDYASMRTIAPRKTVRTRCITAPLPRLGTSEVCKFFEPLNPGDRMALPRA